MAVKKRSTRSPLERTESWDGGCYYLEGRRGDLIQSGEVLPEWLEFGIDKDERGRCVRTRILSRIDRRRIKITDIGGERFKICVRLTPEEAKARYREMEELRELERAKEAEKEHQARLPKTEDEYRARTLEFAGYLARFIDGYVCGTGDGFRFDTKTYESCVAAYRTIENAIREGRIISREQQGRPGLRVIHGGRS